MTTYRIMAIQETGEESCIENNVSDADVAEAVEVASDRYPEWRIFTETENTANYGYSMEEDDEYRDLF